MFSTYFLVIDTNIGLGSRFEGCRTWRGSLEEEGGLDLVWSFEISLMENVREKQRWFFLSQHGEAER